MASIYPSDRLKAILETIASSLGYQIRLLPLGRERRPKPADDEIMVPLPDFGLQAEILAPPDRLDSISNLIRNLAAEIRHQEQESLSLTEEIVERYQQLAILFEMSERLGQARDYGARARAVLQTALESADASGGCLLLNGQELTLYFLKTETDEERQHLLNLAQKTNQSGQTSVDEHRHIALPLLVSHRGQVGSLALGPRNRGQYRSGDLKILSTLGAYAALLIDSDRLYRDLENMFFGTVRSLVEAIDAKDPRTRGHSERVRQFSLLIAQGLGIEVAEVKRLELAALLHDVGKIGLPDTILNNRGDLSPEQWSLVKQHPQMGVAIMAPVSHVQDILPAIGEHHERFDGQGYPAGKAGREIALFARIIAVADAFDAMTMERTYRTTFTREQALEEVARNAGTQFDPEMARLFCQRMASSV